MSPSVAQPSASFALHADTWDARRASRWLMAAALRQQLPREQIVRLDHCLDEALANVIRHGGPGALASPVELHLDVVRGSGTCSAALSVSDAGVAFDPSAHVAEAPHPASLAEAKLGGLGLPLLRNFSDDLSYRRSDGRNHLTITVRWIENA